MNNWKLRHSFTGNATSDVQTVNGYLASGEDNDFAVTVVPDGKEYAAPLFIPRTNLVTYSEDFSAWSSYFYGGASLAIDAGYASPEGNDDATRLSYTAGTGNNGILLTSEFTATASVDYTLSVWMKGAVGGEKAQLRLKNRFSDGPSGTIFTLTNQWVLYTDTITNTAGTSRGFQIAINDAIGVTANQVVHMYGAQAELGSYGTAYIPTNGSAVTRDWSAFGRVQNQLPGISNGTHTHTGAASGSGIAATTITGSGSGATFAYDFDTLGVLTTLTADGAGSGYKVGDKLSIDTTEGHTIEFRLVEGSNAATVSVSMDATRPNKPIPFPVSKMRVEGLTDRTVLFLDRRSQYVFPKPTPYLLDTYEGAAAAYSLRRLRSSYTGPAVRVRRASNNDELDIYFNRDGSLDTATLEAFCAGTDGFVKVWYGQGQEGNDATQTTTAGQPQIVSSGSVVTENGLPTVQFTDSTFEVGSTDLYGQTNFDAYIAYATSDTSYILFGDSTGGGYFSYVISTETSTALQSGYNETSLYVNGAEVPIDAATTTRQDLKNACVLGTMTLEVHQGHTTSSWVDFKISAYSGRKLTGNVSEIILYNSDQSSNREGIEDNINEHYGIYP